MAESDLSWTRRAMRWGQINIREIEPPDFDVAWWEQFWQRIHLDGITLNAGGVWAYYPTQLTDQHRSRWLGERDLFGELVQAARRSNVRVLARIDPGESHDDVYWRHPDWFALDGDGEPMREQGLPELYVPCMNGPYYWDFVPEIMREIDGLYDVDGFFCSEWDGRRRVCHCARCAELFRRASGCELPQSADPSDMSWKRWVAWHQSRLEDLWRHWDGFARRLRPGLFWMGNHSDRGFLADLAEMINVDNQSRRGDHPLWAVGEQGKKMRAITRGKKPYFHIFSSNSYSRHVAKPEAEYRLYIADALLADSRPWFTIIGGVQADQRQFEPLAAMYRWHYDNERYLRDRHSLADVALAFYDRQRFIPHAAAERTVPGSLAGLGVSTQHQHDAGDAFRGMYYGLLRGRVPFDLIHAARMDDDALAAYKLLILPNIAALSDEEAANVRRFVERGGHVIATYQTGAYDEWGRPRARGVLDDLFGIAQRSPSMGPLVHSYMRVHHENGQHPLLAGLEDTGLTLNTDHVVPVQAAPGTDASALTLVPPYPTYPPETAFSRTEDSGIPLVLVTDGQDGQGRRVYWPGNIDGFLLAANAPDHARLLMNSVCWTLAASRPADVIGPGLIEMHPYRQADNIQVHLVNFTNPDTWRAPVHELLPVGEQRVRVRLSDGETVARQARCLVSGQQLPVSQSAGWAEARLPELLDHEIVVFDLE